jgi:hypothetical protein
MRKMELLTLKVGDARKRLAGLKVSDFLSF